MSLVAAIIAVTSTSLDCAALPAETTTTNPSLTSMRSAWNRVHAVASDLHGTAVTLRLVDGATKPAFCREANVVVVGVDWVTQLAGKHEASVTEALLTFVAGHEAGHAIEAMTAGTGFSELRADARGLFFSLRAGLTTDQLAEPVAEFVRGLDGANAAALHERSQAVLDLMQSQWVRLDERTRGALILAMLGESATALALVDETEEVTVKKGLRIPELNAVRLSIHLLELGKDAPARCVPLTPTEGLVLRGPIRAPQLAKDPAALARARAALKSARADGGLASWLLDGTEGCIEFYAGNRRVSATKIEAATKTAPASIVPRLNENLAVVRGVTVANVSKASKKSAKPPSGVVRVPSSCPWEGSRTLRDRSFTVCGSGRSFWFEVKTATEVFTGVRRPLETVDTTGCRGVGFGSAGQQVVLCGTRIVVGAPDSVEVVIASQVRISGKTTTPSR